MLHQRWIQRLGLAMAMVVLATVGGRAARAGIMDSLDDTSNFDGGFGGTTATNNFDGTVTLTRTVPSVDAGIDWMIGGTTKIPLNGANDELVLLPVGTTDGGFYSVSLLFFDGSDAFLGEPYWILNSNSTSPQVLPSVSAFAAANVISGAATYFLRFRIQPFDQAPASFTFTEIATPEPTTAMVLAPAALFMIRRRQSRRRAF